MKPRSASSDRRTTSGTAFVLTAEKWPLRTRRNLSRPPLQRGHWGSTSSKPLAWTVPSAPSSGHSLLACPAKSSTRAALLGLGRPVSPKPAVPSSAASWFTRLRNSRSSGSTAATCPGPSSALATAARLVGPLTLRQPLAWRPSLAPMPPEPTTEAEAPAAAAGPASLEPLPSALAPREPVPQLSVPQGPVRSLRAPAGQPPAGAASAIPCSSAAICGTPSPFMRSFGGPTWQDQPHASAGSPRPECWRWPAAGASCDGSCKLVATVPAVPSRSADPGVLRPASSALRQWYWALAFQPSPDHQASLLVALHAEPCCQ
mmetsp:Transcript_32877/g.102380  ORF Transcript_32877/g.102380 Transcript_32877/m.102380 type:complete len:317 (+) Transcript_32877:781-1731(+)